MRRSINSLSAIEKASLAAQAKPARPLGDQKEPLTLTPKVRGRGENTRTPSGDSTTPR